MPGEVARLRVSSDRLLERELFVCTVSELDLLEVLGEPSSSSVSAAGPAHLVWHLEWPCGLTASIELDQLTQRLTGHLDRPEVQHAFRHLRIEPKDIWLLQTEVPHKFAAQCEAPDPSYELWCQDENGVRTLLEGGLTEGDADCWCDELQRADQRCHCWVQRHKGEGVPEASDAEVRQHLIERLSRARSPEGDQPPAVEQ